MMAAQALTASEHRLSCRLVACTGPSKASGGGQYPIREMLKSSTRKRFACHALFVASRLADLATDLFRAARQTLRTILVQILKPVTRCVGAQTAGGTMCSTGRRERVLTARLWLATRGEMSAGNHATNCILPHLAALHCATGGFFVATGREPQRGPAAWLCRRCGRRLAHGRGGAQWRPVPQV